MPGLPLLPSKRQIKLYYRKALLKISVATHHEEFELRCSARLKEHGLQRKMLPELLCENALVAPSRKNLQLHATKNF